MCIYVSTHVLNDDAKYISYRDQKNSKATDVINKCGWICLQEEDHEYQTYQEFQADTKRF